MTTQKLHFKIHPNILNLIRQAYWLEEGRQDWAMRCLHSLDGEHKMTLDMAFQLLNGDAYFITTDDGKTLTMVQEEDKEWKEEIAEHKEFVKMRKEQEKFNRGRDEETEEELQYKASLAERLSTINRLAIDSYSGEIKSTESTMEMLQKEANMKLAKVMFIQKMTAKTDSERQVADELMKSFRDKQYEFTFEGHHYTFDDSARNQSECPHCGEHSNNVMWHEFKDKGFIGYHDFGTGIFAKCFECPKCFQKFYFHTTFKDYKRED